jgi:hypothetical protein
MMAIGDAPPPRTFAEILPPELITTPSLSNSAAPRGSSRFSSSLYSKTSTPMTSTRQNETHTQPPSKQRLVDAMRRSALPKMQGVVSDLRRSVTSLRRDKNKPSSSRFNTAPKRGASGLGSGSYTRFADEDNDEAGLCEVGEAENENETGGLSFAMRNESVVTSISRRSSESLSTMPNGVLDRSGSSHRSTMSTDRVHF